MAAALALSACDTPEVVKPSQPPEPPLNGSISGLVEVDGQPAYGVRATVTPGGETDWTDANGWFNFPGLEAGQYTATIDPPALTRFDSVAKSATLTPGAPHVAITFKGGWLPTASIRGVVALEGEPVERTVILSGDRIDGDRESPGPDFAFDSLPAGRYALTARPLTNERFDTLEVALQRNEAAVVDTLNGVRLRSASIRGVVAVEGEPANRTVILSGNEINGNQESRGPNFAFDGLPAGHYALTARPLTNEPDMRFDTLKVVLQRGEAAVVDTLHGRWLRTAAIRGSVLIDGLEDRTPGRLVVLSSGILPGGSLVFTLRDNGGGFAFDSLRAASYTLAARAGPDEEVGFDRIFVRVAPGDTVLQNATGGWIRESGVAGPITVNGEPVPAEPRRLVRLTATFLSSPIEFLSSASPVTGNAWFAKEDLRSGSYRVTVVPSAAESGLVFDRVEFRANRREVARVSVNGEWKGGLAHVSTTAYVVQSIQRPEGTVDLVSGKPSLLRAFVTSSLPRPWPDSVTADVVAEAPTGNIRRRFRLERGRPKSNRGLPDTMEEWDLSSSYNVVFPDGIVVPGNGLHITTEAHFDAASRLSMSPESDLTHFQRRAVHAPEKHFDLVVVPFHTGDQAANARMEARVAELDEGDRFFAVALETLPLGVFSLQVRDPVTIDPSDYSSICSWLDLLDQRRNGDQTSFFYGVFDYGASDLGGPYAGCAWLSIPTAVGLIDTNRWSGAAYTFAHEIGHNLSLMHAPCGGPANVDPRFPYSGGTIGVWGYRPSTREVIAQDVPDLMSYCGGGSEWISDYHFEKALAFVNRAWSAHRGPKIAIPEVWDPEQLRRTAGAEHTSVTRLRRP